MVDRDSNEVKHAIERFMLTAMVQVLDGNGLTFSLPQRGKGNEKYVPELKRIVLGDKMTERDFGNLGSVRKVAITTRVLELIHDICSKNIHTTKRDLFYTDVKLFKKQTESDAVLEDVACLLVCTRTSLCVVAGQKGMVLGRLQYVESGDPIDCSRMGIGGKGIPPYMDKITNIRSDAKFILVIEKEAAFYRLAEDRFYNTYPCIMITGKGQPDVATRMFVRRLKEALRIPVLALVDSDSYGVNILSVYMHGSQNMAYDSSNLTTPDIKWLGVRPSDLDRFNIPEQCRLPLTDTDIRHCESLLKEDWLNSKPEWKKEVQLMLKTKVKAEIQSLSSHGIQYLTKEYLPLKLQQGDWI